MMQLHELVTHLNKIFAQEHECDFQPFALDKNKVKGIFGIACISSEFTPIYSFWKNNLIAGYAAKAKAVSASSRPAQMEKVRRLLDKTLNKPGYVSSVVTFDRLCRTVNLLNYLELAKQHNFLITEVDPYHILSIPDGHGAYFEDIIVCSGLKTQNVVISMSTAGVHHAHYAKLLQGLENYRECGYQIALNVGHLFSADKNLAFITELQPDYVMVSASHEGYTDLTSNASLLGALSDLTDLIHTLDKQIILQDVNQRKQAWYAVKIGFDMVQGRYYDTLAQVQENLPLEPELGFSDYRFA